MTSTETPTSTSSGSSPLSFVLYESASGYALFDIVEMERIGSTLSQTCSDFSLFGSHVKLKAFQPFHNAENALENMNAVSEGIVTDDLINFLKMNCPKSAKKYTLGVSDKGLATALISGHKIQCQSGDNAIMEISRGIRMFFRKFVAQLDHGGIEKAQLGLGHAYSRAKVKFNVNRADNMIIQAIALIDQLDKDVNTFAMRVREWYSWHFPELLQFVNDNYVYARCASFIKHRSSLEEQPEKIAKLAEIVMDEDKANQILQASKVSMGMDMSEIDMINIENFTSRLIKLAEYRIQLSQYLKNRMASVAPNLGALIGETVAARLISHAGSLTNLAKAPASTVQILGAEKALFRALKTRGNTPKYGLIFHSSFIGRAGAKNKGRISRYLANKCSIASRVDAFIDVPTTKYGDMMKTQVEERLAFYESGTAPRKNVDVMKQVADGLKIDGEDNDAMDTTKEVVAVTEEVESKKKSKRKVEDAATPKSSKKSKKSKKTAEAVVEAVVVEETPVVEETVAAVKSAKKSKKSKKADVVVATEESTDMVVDTVVPTTPKSSKKKKKASKETVEEPVAAVVPSVKSDKKKKKKSKTIEA